MAVERKQTFRDIAGKENLILRVLEDSEDWEDGEAEAKKVLEVILAGTVKDRARKVDRTYYAMRSLEAKVRMLKAEEKHLADMRRAAENQASRLKAYLRLIAQDQGLAKGEPVRFEGEVHRITVSESGFSVHVDDPELLPDTFRKPVRVLWHPDKKGIAKYVKETGKVPAGVEVEPIVQVRFR